MQCIVDDLKEFHQPTFCYMENSFFTAMQCIVDDLKEFHQPTFRVADQVL